jgi:hypothetical protein
MALECSFGMDSAALVVVDAAADLMLCSDLQPQVRLPRRGGAASFGAEWLCGGETMEIMLSLMQHSDL